MDKYLKYVFIVFLLNISSVKSERDLLNRRSIILLEDFAKPVHNWKQLNDPVMGGLSYGSFKIIDNIYNTKNFSDSSATKDNWDIGGQLHLWF